MVDLDQLVEEASMESFPASDAPSWAPVHAGTPAPLHRGLATLRETCDEVRADVERIAGTIGERNDRSPAALESLRATADHVRSAFVAAGLPVTRYPIGGTDGVENVEARVRGSERPSEAVVVGAHYDSARGARGADDDASGVAALLALARALAARSLRRSVRLVAFANEEPPHTRRRTMGSLQYARMLRDGGVAVAGMISLECVGSFTARRPWIALVGDRASRDLLVRARRAFEAARTDVPTRVYALPGFLPFVKSSDHWSFWKSGFPAFMLTDTGPFRYRHDHRASDTPDRLDYVRLARLIPGIAAMVCDLAA